MEENGRIRYLWEGELIPDRQTQKDKLEGDDLKKRIVELVKQMQKEARKGLRELLSAKNREGRNEKLAKLREETRRKIRAVLTDEQKAKVDEMVGPPFRGPIVFEDGEGGAKD